MKKVAKLGWSIIVLGFFLSFRLGSVKIEFNVNFLQFFKDIFLFIKILILLYFCVIFSNAFLFLSILL